MAKEITIQPYTSIPYVELENEDSYEDITKARSIQVGFGSKVLRVDRQGLWMGADNFADAPFSVDMEGNVTATTLVIGDYLEVGEALADIGLGGVTEDYISVPNLAAINADLGSINAGTITGALIRTSSSGARIEIDDTTDTLEVYDSGSTKRLELDQDELIFYGSTGTRRGYIKATTTNLEIVNDNGGFVVLNVDSTSYGIEFQIVGAAIGAFTVAGLGMQENIEMNSNDITGVDDITMASTTSVINMNGGEITNLEEIRFEAQTANPSGDGTLRYYANGGSEGLRMQFGGSDFQFDATGV